jgi:hypothetical protein
MLENSNGTSKPIFDLENKVKNILGIQKDVGELAKTAAVPEPEKIEVPQLEPMPTPPSIRDMRPAFSPEKLRGTWSSVL